MKPKSKYGVGQQCWPTFEDARDAILIADVKTGRIIDCNKQAEILLQRKRTEIIGLHQSDIHPAEEKTTYKKVFKRHVQTKGRDPFEGEIVRKNGKRISVEISASLLRRPGNGYVLQGVFRDITKQKQMIDEIRASKDRFQAAFESPAVGLAIVGLDGKWLQVNPTMTRILGYTKKQLESGKYQDITHPEDQEKSRRMMIGIATGKTNHVRFEKRYLRPNKTVIWAMIHASLVRDAQKKPQYVVSIIEDITNQKRSEAALLESEEKFRKLADKSLVGIYIIQDGIFQYVNPRMAQIFRYRPSELIGKKNVIDIASPQDRDLVATNIARRITKKVKTVHYRFNGQTKFGDLRRVDVLGSYMVVNGRPAIIGTLLDVTEDERKDYELRDRAEELNKFQLAVAGASDHIIITDPDGMILYANRAAEQITGYKVDEMLGKNAGQLWGGKMDPTYYKQMWLTISQEKKNFKGEFENHRKNGDTYTAESSITPILNKAGKVIFYVGIERDITKAKEIDRMKSEFISVASHQLRTPLSTAGWYADMLLHEDAGALTEQQKKFVSEISRANQRSIALINALLSVSRIDSGKMLASPRSVNLVSIAQNVIAGLKPLSERSRVRMEHSFDPKIPNITVDPDILSLALQNILSNAIKYTPAGGKVSLKGKFCDNEVCIEVHDTGIGIPKSVHDRLFSMFFRADNARSKDPDGTGLGLYIAKSAVELTGGKIWFTSTEGKGSTFTFTIPANPPKTNGNGTMSKELSTIL